MPRLFFAGLLACVLLGGGLFGLASPVGTATEQRGEAQERWSARAIEHYRVTVQLELASGPCVQELEVRDGQTPAITLDTCSPSWLSRLTVSRLFDLSERLEQPSDCYPSTGSCVCRRVRLGQVRYDDRLGYPQVLDWRREVRPNWHHPDYWRQALQIGGLPSCNATTTRVRITVMSLVPLS